jgi:hypothetical protein
MLSFPHRIRRQRWLIRAGTTADAFKIRRWLRYDGQDLLLPAFDRAFDHVGRGADVIRIPTLRVRFNIASEEKMTELLPELIYEQLLEQLREILDEQPGGDRTRSERQTLTRHQVRLEILLEYLRTGSIGWEAASTLPVDELAGELKQICGEQRPEVLELIRREQSSPDFFFRLFQLVPAVDARVVVSALLENVSRPWKAPLREIICALLESGERYLGHYLQWEVAALLVTAGLAQCDQETAPDIFRVAERSWSSGSARKFGEFIASLPASIVEAFQTSKTVHELSDDAADPEPGGGESSVEAPPGTVMPPAADLRVREAFVACDKPSPVASVADVTAPRAKPGGRMTGDFPLLVSHAGLILLHPYLARFLESTGIKEKSERSLSSRVLPRATALLHFLTTGQEEIYEFDLAFIKVLLGVSPETSLCVAGGLLAEGDRQECETLLGSVISHWPALRNTSVAGLRHSFLQRQGLLRDQEDGWKLQIERQTFDVLLESLPWGFSTVKLSWMKKPIYTEW